MKVIIKSSIIDWKWIFANQDIKKWEIILKWDTSQNIPKNIWEGLSSRERKYVSIINGQYIEMQEPEKYMNHSCSPNSKADNLCDLALRDITKWEEITWNNNDVGSSWELIPCNCGSKDCIWKIFS